MRFMTQETARLVLVAGVLGTSPVAHSQPAAPPQESVEQAVRRDRYGDPLPPEAVARLGTVRLRPGAAECCPFFSPDGKTLFAARRERANASEYDPPVQQWDTATGRALRRFGTVGDGHGYRASALSPQGNILAIGSQRGHLLELWEVATGRKLAQLGTGDDEHEIYALVFSPDGKTVSLAGHGTVHVWDVATGKKTRHFAPQLWGSDSRASQTFFLSPDGKTFGALSPIEDKDAAKTKSTIRLWDVASGRECRSFGQFDASFDWHFVFSPDGRILAVGGGNDAIQLWDVATGKKLRELPTEAYVVFLAFAPDAKTLATVEEGKGIRIWDVKTGKSSRELAVPWARALAFTPDGNTLAVAVASALRLLDVATGKDLVSLVGHQAVIGLFAFAPDGRSLITGAEHLGEFGLWETATGKRLHWRQEREGRFYRAFAAHHKTLAMYDMDGENDGTHSIRLWDVAKDEKIRSWKNTPDVQHGPIGFLGFGRGGEVLVATDADTVWSWTTATGKKRSQFRFQVGQDEAAWRWALSPDGKLLAGGNAKKMVRIWEVETGKEQPALTLLASHILSLAFSPDSKALAVESCFGAHYAVQLWDLETRKEIRRFRPDRYHPYGWPIADRSRRLAFSPDGRMLAGGCSSARVYVWETATGHIRHRFAGHQDTVVAVAFAPDSKQLASGSGDTTALIWDITGQHDLENRQAVELSAESLQKLWGELAGDGALAYQAFRTLLAHPRQTITFLHEQLRPVPVGDVREVARLIQGLDDQDFTVRNKARMQLEQLRESAQRGMNEALKGPLSLEAQTRVTQLLSKLDKTNVPSPEQLRSLRALEVVEHLGMSMSGKLLEQLACGAPKARLTAEAKAALQRLREQSTLPREAVR